VRSQLGFTSLRLPSSGHRSSLWRRLFPFSRSRRSGSLALVSADLEDGTVSSDLPSPDSDDPDAEGERGLGAAGGPVAPLPQKTPPSAAVEAVVFVTTSVTPTPTCRQGLDRLRENPAASSPAPVVTPSPDPESHSYASEFRAPPTSALQRLAQNLHRLARNLTRTSLNWQDQNWTNHSPLHHLETGIGGSEAGEQRDNGEEEEEDVELLIPASDFDSSSPPVPDIRQPLLERNPASTTGHAPRHNRGNGGGRDGPCEHCGMVHTARIPDACLEATSKTESSDDELLLLC